MSDPSCALFALVNAAASLRPMPAEDDSAPVRASSPSSSPSSAPTRSHSEHTMVSEEDERSQASSSTTTASSASFADSPAPTRKKSAPLPLVLMELLSDPTQSDVISFLPDGLSFAVHYPHAFVNDHMPRLFHCVKLHTFVKKLERWGFHQADSLRRERLAFAHPLFRRGDWDSCRKIRCVKKSSKSRQNSSPPPSPLASPRSSPAPEPRTYRGAFAEAKTAAETAPLKKPLLQRSLLPQEEKASPMAAASSFRIAEQQAAVAQQRQHAILAAAARAQQCDIPSGDLSAAAAVAAGVSFSQAEVDLATLAVMGPAMDVLARDKRCLVPHGPEARRSPPLLARQQQRVAAAMVSVERMKLLRMEAKLAATRKAEAELLAARRRRLLLVSAAAGGR